MLETIREYGLDRLSEEGEAHEAHQRHAGWVLALAEQAQPALELGAPADEQRAWLDRLGVEHDNLRAALGWALGHEPATALRTLAMAGWFWVARGHYAECRALLERALAAGGGEPPDRATALARLGTIAWLQGDLAAAEERLGEALRLFDALGDEPGSANASSMLGNVAGDAGDTVRARAHYGRGLGIARGLGDLALTSLALGNLAVELVYHGEHAAARPLLEEVIGIARGLGDVVTQANAHNNLGDMAEAIGDAAVALAEYRWALRLAWETREPDYVLVGLDGLAVALRHAAPGDAARLLGAAEAARRAVGIPVQATNQALHDRGVAEARAALGAAAFEAAWAAGEALSLDEAVAEALALADALAVEPDEG